MKPHDKTIIVQCVIGWDLSWTYIVMNRNIWFAESSHAYALWRHDWDINNQIMAILPIFQGQLAIFVEENVALNHNANGMKSVSS